MQAATKVVSQVPRLRSALSARLKFRFLGGLAAITALTLLATLFTASPSRASTLFEETCDGLGSLQSQWQVDANAGSIDVSGGSCNLSAGSTRTFPYIRRSGGFPTSGDFTLTVQLRWPSVAVHGVGFGAGTAPDNGAALGIWQDSNNGFHVDVGGRRAYTSGTKLDYHSVRFEYRSDGSAHTVLDATDLGTFGNVPRPSAMFFGNPTVTCCAAQWSSLSVDTIRVEVPTPPPPGRPSFAVQGPNLSSCGPRYEMGQCYKIKFTVTNDGTASGSSTLGVQESGDYSQGDTGGFQGQTVQNRSFTLSPGQSTQITFVAFHRWNWINPSKSGLKTAINYLSLGTTCAPLPGKLGEYAKYPKKAYDFYNIINTWLGPLARLGKTFTYSPASGSLPFNSTAVTLVVPQWKAQLFVDSFVLAWQAKLWACSGWIVFRAGSGIATPGMLVSAGIIQYHADLLYKAAWDPDPAYNIVPVVQAKTIPMVDGFTDPDIRASLQRTLDASASQEALSESLFRYAAAIEAGALDAAAKQLNAVSGFSSQVIESLEDASRASVTLIGLGPASISSDQGRLFVDSLGANGLPSELQQSLVELGYSSNDLADLRAAWNVQSTGDPTSLTREDLYSSRLGWLSAISTGQAGFLGLQQEAESAAGRPTTNISLSGPTGNHGWFLGPVSVTLTAVPAVETIAKTEYSLDNGNSWTLYQGPFVVLAEGRRVLMVRSQSSSGTFEDPPSAVPVWIDVSPPQSTDNVPPAWSNTPTEVVLGGTDSTSGLGGFYYSTDGSEPTLASPVGTTFLVSAEGVFSIKYFSVDNAGNYESPHSAQTPLKLDFTPPNSSVDPPVIPAFLLSVHLSGLAQDNLSGIDTVSIRFSPMNGDPALDRTAIVDHVSGTWDLLTTVPPGIYDVVSIATDNAKNTQVQFGAAVRVVVVSLV